MEVATLGNIACIEVISIAFLFYETWVLPAGD